MNRTKEKEEEGKGREERENFCPTSHLTQS